MLPIFKYTKRKKKYFQKFIIYIHMPRREMLNNLNKYMSSNKKKIIIRNRIVIKTPNKKNLHLAQVFLKIKGDTYKNFRFFFFHFEI